MNLIQQIEAEEIAKAAKEIPVFRPGDTVRVGVKVIEGERSRVQNYEGVCIARSNKDCLNIRTIPARWNGKGARSPKCCDRGIMRRSRRGESHRPRSTHGYAGRIFGSVIRALGSSLPDRKSVV